VPITSTRAVASRRAVALLCGLVLAGAAGCAGRAPSPTALRLEREDLIALVHALQSAQPSVQAEVRAAKAAWPLVVNGLPRGRPLPHAPVRTAAAAAAAVFVPAILQEDEAGALTGPAATIGGLFHGFVDLAGRGWQLIEGSIAQIQHGPPAAARFARANVALYIESVYDGHFDLAQVGKQLTAGYRKLGGPAAFGTSLTGAEVDALARAYSEASDRLHPHVGVKLGS
jgi:hypothetical protein